MAGQLVPVASHHTCLLHLLLVLRREGMREEGRRGGGGEHRVYDLIYLSCILLQNDKSPKEYFKPLPLLKA